MFKAEADSTLAEEDTEKLAVIATEIYADFGDDTLISTVVEVILSNSELSPLPGGVAYSRDVNYFA